MILYTNGDSHTAGAEAVVPAGWAQDDPLLYHLGRAPHPYNAAVSWGCRLASALGAEWVNHAQSGSSNHRIVRTTREWLSNHTHRRDVLVIIQWSTWEREEWRHKKDWIQVTASGTDSVPRKLADRYRQWVCDIDWPAVTKRWHDEIWQFHEELQAQGIKHVFFNGNTDFARITDRRDWAHCYFGAYDAQKSFNGLLRSWGHATVNPKSWHFGPESHRVWSEIMLQYLLDNNMVDRDAISLD